MSLFDPYSQKRLFELRQEQLAHKARRQNQLRLARVDAPSFGTSAKAIAHMLAGRLHRSANDHAGARPPGRSMSTPEV
jgi:hypothetical protein